MFFFNFPGRGMREVGLCHPPVIFMRPWALNYLELPCLSSPPSFPKENGQVLLLLQFPNSKPMIPRKKLEIFLSKTLLQSDRPPLETDIPLRNRIIMSKQEERTRVFFRFSFFVMSSSCSSFEDCFCQPTSVKIQKTKSIFVSWEMIMHPSHRGLGWR